MSSQIYRGDGLEGLRGLSGVDMVLTDIPSGKTRNEWDALPDPSLFFERAWAALKPSGALVVMVSHLDVAAEFVRWPHYRYDLIWAKSVATGFLNAGTQPLRAHEHILVFYREQPTYSPQMSGGHKPIGAWNRAGDSSENYGKMTRPTRSRAGATDRHPSSVLTFGSVGTSSTERVHPQQKPVDLLRWLIMTYTNSGDLVADPFAGSGSTGVAAADCGRRFVGWEIRDTPQHPTFNQQRLLLASATKGDE